MKCFTELPLRGLQAEQAVQSGQGRGPAGLPGGLGNGGGVAELRKAFGIGKCPRDREESEYASKDWSCH